MRRDENGNRKDQRAGSEYRMRQILLTQTVNIDVVLILLLWSMILNAIFGGAIILLLFRLAQCKEKLDVFVHGDKNKDDDKSSED